ncbi:MAG TPA: hypothetical protein PLF40_28790 [Kofleriaceae bacterium]|nr:hypothetical protein [Kofleriaceae bacterium]
MRTLIALVGLAVATLSSCGVTQSQGPYLILDGNNRQIDGASSVDAQPADAAPDAKVCSNGRVIFLNFEGVTLTRAASDATMNRANWLPGGSATIPQFRANDGGRATLITNITDLAKANLAQFPVTIVTTRPTTGPYIMVAFGGARAMFNTTYPSITGLNCGDVRPSGVGWVADDVTAQQGANLVVSVAAISIGLTGITENKPRDCLCGWGGPVCDPDQTQACQLSTSVQREQRCAGEPATQNEVTAFNRAFCEMR